MIAGLVDGVLLLAGTEQGVAWYRVAGFHHHRDRVYAIPYRKTDCRPHSRGIRAWSQCLGIHAPMLPRGAVVDVVAPRPSTVLPPGIHRVLGEFLSKLGFDESEVFVTGSHAVGCAGEGSDVDIVAPYSSGVIEELRVLRGRGLVSQCRLGTVASKRGRGPGGVALDEDRIMESLLDSCYRGVPYTLRLLQRSVEGECLGARVPVGEARIVAELIPLSPYTVPALYRLRVLHAENDVVDRGIDITLVTWRTRYQELPRGVYRVRGLARVNSWDGSVELWPDYGGVVEWA